MTLSPSSLSGKLALGLVVLFVVVGGLTLAITVTTSHLYQQEVQQRLHGELARHILAEEGLMENGAVANDALKHVFHMMMVINPTIELYLLDPSGRILAYSAPPGRVKLARVDLEPVEAFVADRARLPILGDDPRHPDRRKIFSAAPIRRDGVIEGYLYIVLASEQLESAAGLLRGSHILRTGAWAMVGGIGVTLVGALMLSRPVTRRLSSLSRDLADFRARSMDGAAGSADSEGTAQGDEIDQLRTSFSEMAARIEHQIAELEAQDRVRRDMVANVSHDLRTPLAHLQGYLETLMLKETTLSPDERREYLEIAHRQGERLGRLVSDLFELAKLESCREPLTRERLPVGELVQDVVQKYRLAARDQGIAIEAVLEGSNRMIAADVGLLERALENVIENALRLTPAGGRIDVHLEPHEDWVRIEVRDTGPGISDDDLPGIFERFSTSSLQDDDERRGAGLGLSIARRVVELHGGTLACESLRGHGTTFRFELPAA